MNANELRIGNWVNQGEVYGDNKVSSYEIHNYYRMQGGGVVADYYRKWKPIPLTDEWLLKFGFVDDNKPDRDKYETFTSVSWLLRGATPISAYFRVYQELDKTKWKRKDIRDIETGEYSVWANQNWTQSVNHVHQLQNLYFALTGKELNTIE